MNKIVTPVLAISLFLLAFGKMSAQSFPDEMHFSPDGKRLITGGNVASGFYDESSIHTIELIFDEPNYWTILTNNYNSSTDLGAVMVLNGDTLASEVGVRFKGQTSYSQTQNTQKKSFNITLDWADPDQDIDGYETLNLNNCFQDPSFIREALYLHQSRKHTQSLKANYVQLYINGEYWGPYPNVQALDGKFTKEWFLSSDGTRWRALKTIGGGGPGGGGGTGGPFGTGYCSLNWLGTDSSEYKKFYTLKKTSKTNPWEDLIKTCDKLNNTPLAALEDSIKNYMDLDRTLWFLATENAFADDDGYIFKGGMDYYLYWEPETNRIVPIEYDGNSILEAQAATWSPFYNQQDVRYPLLNRLLAVPAIRQRYLAHLRTIIADELGQADIDGQIEEYFQMIDGLVAADTKKIYSYQEFVNEKNTLKNLFQTRRNTLLGNSEVNSQGLVVNSAVMSSANGTWTSPDAGQPATIMAQVAAGTLGISQVVLHYSSGLVGKFEKTVMFDDGAHNDGAAGDGLFGAQIPGFGNGSYVRFYIEAIANNTAKTATYFPKGAEYDVFIYQVGVTEFFDSPVVVNEIMASNQAAVADQDGEFEDWIELYNNSTDAVDLSGWHLTDNYTNLSKWTFPEGTSIPGTGYLIVWADEDGSQAGLHANFKLSAGGESLYLLDPDLRIGQELVFGSQTTDMGYARVPNGIGDFVIQTHTFNANNENGVNATSDVAQQSVFKIFPNPASDEVTIRSLTTQLEQLQIFNVWGQIKFETVWQGNAKIDVSNWQSGVYFVKSGAEVLKLVIE